jgi:hypothetical protein
LQAAYDSLLEAAALGRDERESRELEKDARAAIAKVGRALGPRGSSFLIFRAAAENNVQHAWSLLQEARSAAASRPLSSAVYIAVARSAAAAALMDNRMRLVAEAAAAQMALDHGAREPSGLGQALAALIEANIFAGDVKRAFALFQNLARRGVTYSDDAARVLMRAAAVVARGAGAAGQLEPAREVLRLLRQVGLKPDALVAAALAAAAADCGNIHAALGTLSLFEAAQASVPLETFHDIFRAVASANDAIGASAAFFHMLQLGIRPDRRILSLMSSITGDAEFAEAFSSVRGVAESRSLKAWDWAGDAFDEIEAEFLESRSRSLAFFSRTTVASVDAYDDSEEGAPSYEEEEFEDSEDEKQGRTKMTGVERQRASSRKRLSAHFSGAPDAEKRLVLNRARRLSSHSRRATYNTPSGIVDVAAPEHADGAGIHGGDESSFDDDDDDDDNALYSSNKEDPAADAELRILHSSMRDDSSGRVRLRGPSGLLVRADTIARAIEIASSSSSSDADGIHQNHTGDAGALLSSPLEMIWNAPTLLQPASFDIELPEPKAVRRRAPGLALLRVARAFGVHLGAYAGTLQKAEDGEEQGGSPLVDEGAPRRTDPATSAQSSFGLEVGENGALAYDGSKPFAPIARRLADAASSEVSRSASEKSIAKAIAIRAATRYSHSSSGLA